MGRKARSAGEGAKERGEREREKRKAATGGRSERSLAGQRTKPGTWELGPGHPTQLYWQIRTTRFQGTPSFERMNDKEKLLIQDPRTGLCNTNMVVAMKKGFLAPWKR